MSTTPWRGTLIFAGTVAAVAAAAAVRFSGGQIEAAAVDTATGGLQSAGSAGTTNGPAQPSATSQAATPPASAGTTSSDPASSAASPSATPSPTPTVAQDVTIVGSTVQTRYGPLQVSVTFAGADITAVQALQAPSWHGESRQINAYAIPILTQEAVAADSASIDAVSGATVTTQAYRQSLQSAIDQHG